MNLATDFNFQTKHLLPDYEGPVTSTLISSKFNVGNRKSILYLHGYTDYFFHAHLCEAFINRGFDFYALDLRKYGRSMLPHQHPNYCLDMEEYFEEITLAIRQIKAAGAKPISLLGHSTGGLLACNYLNDGKERSCLKTLILNSPFFAFNEPEIKIRIFLSAARIVSAFFPYSKVSGVLSPAYPQSIHRRYSGEWDFHLEWKPIEGFPVYFKWVLAVAKAQKKLIHSDIQVPVLVMHSSRSRNVSSFSEEAMSSDIVLNVEDMKRIGSRLGRQVTFSEIDNALHDIFLSSKEVRDDAFNQMFSWLEKSQNTAS